MQSGGLATLYPSPPGGAQTVMRRSLNVPITNLTDDWQGRAKLDPHRALITDLRGKRRSYARIAAVLKQQFGLSVAPSTIYDFLRVRAKHPTVSYELRSATPPTPK